MSNSRFLKYFASFLFILLLLNQPALSENNYKGKLIAVTGIDGSGKSSMVNYLQQTLVKKGYKVAIFKPLSMRQEDKEFFKRIYRLSDNFSMQEKDDIKIVREQFFTSYYSLVFADHVYNEIIPSLASNDFVICDRYLSSHLASQQAFGNDMNNFATLFSKFPKPDYQIFLDVPVNIAMERIKARNNTTFNENAKILTKTKKNLLKLVNRQGAVLIIDSTKPIEVGQKLALEYIAVSAAD